MTHKHYGVAAILLVADLALLLLIIYLGAFILPV